MAEEQSFEYMGKTMIRNGNTVFFGKKEDGIWLELTILDTKKAGNTEIANNVMIQIVSYRDKTQTILKQSFGTSFYESYELGVIWLDRALNGKL